MVEKEIPSPKHIQIVGKGKRNTGIIYPVIRISGSYLNHFDFKIGDRVEVILKHQEIIIKKI